MCIFAYFAHLKKRFFFLFSFTGKHGSTRCITPTLSFYLFVQVLVFFLKRRIRSRIFLGRYWDNSLCHERSFGQCNVVWWPQRSRVRFPLRAISPCRVKSPRRVNAQHRRAAGAEKRLGVCCRMCSIVHLASRRICIVITRIRTLFAHRLDIVFAY